MCQPLFGVLLELTNHTCQIEKGVHYEKKKA